jgi:hypothetical protein
MPLHEQVLALHPAPVSYLPRGSRKWRLDLVRHRTPVRLTHAVPGDFEAAKLPLRGWGGETPRILRNDEGLWSPCVRWTDGNGYATTPSEEVGRYLVDDAAHEIRCAFMETPLNARMKNWDHSRWGDIREKDKYPSSVKTHPSFRGLDVDIDGARDIAWDGRQQAGQAVQAHLDRNVRIVGDEAYFRRDDMLHATWLKLDTKEGYRLEPSPHAMSVCSKTLLASVGNLDRMLAHIEAMGEGHFPVPGFDVAAWRRAAEKGPSGGEDIIQVVNGSCFAVRNSLDRCLAAAAAQGERGTRAAEGLSVLREAALQAEAWSWIGSFGREDPEHAVEWLLKATDTVAEAWQALAMPETVLKTLLDRGQALRDLYLPILRPDPDVEDIRSLSSAVR